MKTALVIMAAGIGSRFGGGIGAPFDGVCDIVIGPLQVFPCEPPTDGSDFLSRIHLISCYVKVKGLNPLFYVFCLFSLLDPHFCLMRQKNSICNFLQFYFKTCNCFAFSIKKSDTVIGNGSILKPRILLFHSKNSIRKLYLSSHPEQG